MTGYVVVFVTALIVAVAATPLAARLARRSGIVDQPNARKVHQTPTPLLGGVAIYLGALLGALLIFGAVAFGMVLVTDALSVPEFVGWQALALLGGATAMAAVGVVDDRHALPWRWKLVAQVAAASLLPLSGIQIGLLRYEPLNVIATVLWVVTVTNAINFLDNMDGLSAGISAVASAFFFLLAAFSHQVIVAGLSVAILGACLGFLRYNFNRASIFMGDAGSLFLGFCLSAIGIKLRFANVDIVTWMIPLLVLGLPLFDISLVVVSRLRHGLSPATAGKDHTSHRLVALGLTRREAVMALYLVSGMLGLAALFVMNASIPEGYVIGGGVLLAAVYAFLRLEQAGELVYGPRRARP